MLTGQMHSFYLVVPPGFETLALHELNEKFPGLETHLGRGGLDVLAPFELGLALHYHLKIPTEIRLRIAEFKCRDFPKLYQKISNIRWGQYLLGGTFQLSVASQKSRLLNEKKISDSVREGIARHFEKQPPKKHLTAEPHEVYVRFFDDVCTTSIDLAGGPLYKRNYKVQRGIAPIRENIAAALFYALHLAAGPFKALLDPMCGTGSLLLEAQRFWQKNNQPFLFEKHRDWLPAEIAIAVDSESKNSATQNARRYFAFDKDENSLASLRETLGTQQADWQISKLDVFKDQVRPLVNGVDTRLLGILCNPPYGERITLPQPAKIYYPQLFDRLAQYQPRAIGFIIPAQYENTLGDRANGYHCRDKIRFKNGGLPVVYGIWLP